jgi:cholesterol transport system auxiliary component
MTPWNNRRAVHTLVVLCAVALSACSVLKPSNTEPPAFYALNATPTTAPARAPDSATRTLPTLVITPTRAAAGFDSQRIIFVRTPHQVEYFAHSEWVDTPARMLGPLLASHMQATGAFGAVVLTPAGATGDLRLETEIIQLQHNFQTSPSRVQLTLRAFLLDDKTRRVLAWREFRAEAPAASDTPQGGVAAANQAVQTVLTELAQFVAAQPK